MNKIKMVIAAVILCGLPVLVNAELNKWTLLPESENGYFGNPLVYSPVRKQLLQYTAFNVKALNADTGKWVSDYEYVKQKGFGVPGHNQHRGVSYKGKGEMMSSGLPAPSVSVGGCTWDSKRNKMVMVVNRFMAAYDSETKTWTEIKCETEVDGKKTPGAPDVYGSGVCYDPVNDEIFMLGHWGGRNYDLREATGEVSGYLGTMVYSFETGVWTRLGDALTTPEVAKARAEICAKLKNQSALLDKLYLAGQSPDRLKIDKEFLDASKVLRDSRLELDKLNYEPPPRCATQPVYDPSTKSIVIFGGMGGLRRCDLKIPQGKGGGPTALNDTWVYDCAKRKWGQVAVENRPPETRWPRMVYDPASRKVILVTATSTWGGNSASLGLWTLDIAKGTWTDHGKFDLPGGKIAWNSWYGWGDIAFELGLDPVKKQLVIVSGIGANKYGKNPLGLVMDLDVSKLTAVGTGEAYTEELAVKPVITPADDPAWIAKLKSMPANSWIDANPIGGKSPSRDWGIAFCDPVRGNPYYFGGGHATYQGRDVGIYCVGANKWVYNAAGHNDHMPAVGWGGANIDFWGSPHAMHQRNSYVAVDGRMYTDIGTGTMRPRYADPLMKEKGARWSQFYDADRGGVWRNPKIDEVVWGEGITGTYAGVHIASPDGRVMGFGGILEPYDGRQCPDILHFASYDIKSSKLTVKNVSKPYPGVVLEVRPFCFIADKGKQGSVFFYEYNKGSGGHATWIYDIADNKFTKLSPKRQPPAAQLGTVGYMPDQKAVFAVFPNLKGDEMWVYSLEKNDWAPLPLTGKVKFQHVYTQTLYAAKYGVVINLPGVEIMRPDVNKAKWW